MKLVILEGHAVNPGDLSWDWLKDFTDEYEVYDQTPPSLVMKRCENADIIVTNKVPITREMIEKLPRLQYIGVLATGYNVIDCEAAREHGIAVSNIPAYSTDAVAQHVFSLLLELAAQTGLHNKSVKDGEWTACPHFCYWKTPLTELSGKTFGIIGFGKIGAAAAQIANAMKMKVIAYSPNTKTYSGFGSVDFVSLDEVIERSDVISLHCPQTAQTEKMVNASFLRRMKNTAFLINTARGGLICEHDLKAALESGEIAGAGVDVLSAEPARADNPLLSSEKCIITPHIAWASFEARSRLMEIFKENVKGFVSGKPVHVVN